MSEAYRVYCEDCDLDEVYDPKKPPDHVVNYWGDVEKARDEWSALSAAKGERDNHAASEFRDYEKGLRHRVHLEEIEPMSNHHAPEHLGEKCPNCGVVHRVLESIPDKPLSREAIDSLEESDSIAFASGIEFYFGEMAGPNAEEATENLVLSTSSATMLLSRYAGTGWVVEQEIEHEPDEDAEEVGREIWMEASQHLSDAVNQMMDYR